jgi:ubiquinone/menaquinone biosynthesis C-methylase UbiE
MVKKDIGTSVADSLETHEDMLPLMPELLHDMWALGSSPELVVKLFKPLNFSPNGQGILDLGCGKGAVTITVARELGLRGKGIDACRAFLDAASEKAREMKVANLCSFEYGDIREVVNAEQEYDAVIYASLGGILGDFKEIVGALRNTVHMGGYILIDDGFFKGTEVIRRKGYEHYDLHEETIRQLMSHGDKLLKEICTDQETKNINDTYMALIEKRGKEMITKSPELESIIMDFVKSQREECDFIASNISGAIWLLQRQS